MKLLKLFEIPHVMTFKRRWVRKVMIIAAFPQEVVRAVYQTYQNAAYWWRQA
ncbi:hypothetical protein [Bradyrhizobium sp. ARR65]|uniref:hypothetical protein n=1 Tax=Bradyrhizobium sp. ARR65 TaxID=1040989 RepID=UPI000AAC1C40|nr:hypothetical protein [Bradyrhizobium sp. ARR65]